MTTFETLRATCSSGPATIGVIGLGYVGLPLAAALHDAPAPAGGAPLRILGFDIDPKKIELLRRGESYLRHLGPDLAHRLGASNRFVPTSDFARLAQCDAILVCVPTPLGPQQQPDLSYVLNTAELIGRTLRAGQLIVLESTTYPGTTRDEFVPAIMRAAASRGPDLQPGRDWFAAFSPEREDPGNTSHSTRTIPKLVGGLDQRSTDLAAALYRRAVREVVTVSSAEVAEAAKLLENIFRAVNIALVNEMKVVLDAMGIDIWEVIRAAATKPFGFMPFYPGPGLGGHCIPIDPFYLAWKAREIGRPTRFIELAGQVNIGMPLYVVDRLTEALARRDTPLAGARILILGLAYKPDIDDVRESPSFELIHLLRSAGATADYSDPHVPATWPGRRADLGMRSVELTPQSLAGYDAAVISTNHSAFDYAMIAEHARLVIDTRDAMRAFAPIMSERLVRA